MFVELHNAGSMTSLSGCQVRLLSGTGPIAARNIPNVTMPPGGFYLVAFRQGTAADCLPNGATLPPGYSLPDVTGAGVTFAPESAELLCGGATMDSVGWTNAGTLPATPEWPRINATFGGTGASMVTSFERKANMDSTPASLRVGGGDLTAGNAYDTNMNAADFVVHGAGFDLQNASSPAEP